jgi:2-keto-4-pentenoate hydratase/2-oxohepta-3-ene-1,7-dioic acid hydratase in catechol pathway
MARIGSFGRRAVVTLPTRPTVCQHRSQLCWGVWRDVSGGTLRDTDMRFLTFEIETPLGREARVGLLSGDDTLVDLNLGFQDALQDEVGHVRARRLASAIVPPDLLTLLANGSAGRDAVARTLDWLGPQQREAGRRAANGGVVVHRLGDVRLLAPIVRPSSIRDCSAYEEHVRNASRGNVPPKWYDIPAYYKGNPDAVIGTGADVTLADVSAKVDYELEYAVVIGRRGVDLREDQVAEHIAGFMVFNDVSVRDLQFREMSINLGPAKGKDLDGSNVLGPFLVTPDEWDPHEDNTMLARVNGEQWSKGTTSSIYHSVERIVSHISQRETLHVGDVIGTGTVGGGCGLELGRYPVAGDEVQLEVEGLGVLTNRWVNA